MGMLPSQPEECEYRTNEFRNDDTIIKENKKDFKIMIRLLLPLLLATCLFGEGKRLSFDQVQGKSPFKYARLGMMVWFPNENAFLTWGKDTFKGDIVKVTFPERDTIEFVDSTTFYLQGKKLKVNSFHFDKSGNKLLLLSDRKRIWRFFEL